MKAPIVVFATFNCPPSFCDRIEFDNNIIPAHVPQTTLPSQLKIYLVAIIRRLIISRNEIETNTEFLISKHSNFQLLPHPFLNLFKKSVVFKEYVKRC